MFAFVTTLDETLRADIRRARSLAESPSCVEVIQGAIYLAERLQVAEVENLLRTALRHPGHRLLLLELAQERMEAGSPE